METRRVLDAIALGCAVITFGPAAADFVITESNVVRYPIGAIMGDGARVSLSPKERVVFIDEAGVVREAVGRFEGRLGDLEALERNRRALRRGFDETGAGVSRPDPVGRDAPDGAVGAARGDAPAPETGPAARGRGRGPGRGGGRGGRKGR